MTTKRVPVPSHTLHFDSVEELAVFAKDQIGPARWQWDWDEDFCGGSYAEVSKLAREGWDEQLPDALNIADEAVSTIEQEHDIDGFHAVYDVFGSDVDVARYLNGEPENMIDYHLVPTPANGRVITLCASVAVSYSIRPGTINKRGAAVAALAFALSRLGFNVELYAEYSHSGRDRRPGGTGKKIYGQIRVMVKGANDELDPAKIMFAYAHPGLFRGLMLPAMHGYPQDWHDSYNLHAGHGAIEEPIEDLPEGTIYLPGIRSYHDVPNADVLLKRHMTALGILPADESN